MLTVEAYTANTLYYEALMRIKVGGSAAAPRLMPTLEVSPAVLVLSNPAAGLVTLPKRRLEVRLGIVEALLLIGGTTDVDLLCCVAPRYARYVNTLTGELDGAYGPRVGPQLPDIERLLRSDNDTRQAVVTIYDGTRDHRESLDVPCTVSLQFMVRNGRLSVLTYMRSNDVWYGTPYDIFQFTTLQRVIAARLYLAVGHYTHVVGSLHLYERNMRGVTRVLADGAGQINGRSVVPNPGHRFADDVPLLLEHIREVVVDRKPWAPFPATIDPLGMWMWDKFQEDPG